MLGFKCEPELLAFSQWPGLFADKPSDWNVRSYAFIARSSRSAHGPNAVVGQGLFEALEQGSQPSFREI